MLIPVDLGPDSDVTHIGVQISADHDLAPGSTFARAELDFWADNVDVYLSAGQSIQLWYGRIVGSGVLIEWADE
jgi:hypothetical protein